MFPDVQVNMIRVVADFVAESLKANKDQRKKKSHILQYSFA